MRANLELKARCDDLDSARSAVHTLDLSEERVQHQIDTYFVATHGRLKLREIDSIRAELIWYDRPNEQSERTSRYQVVGVADGPAMREALTAALGVRGQVRKRREIYIWKNVRIHLDEVEELGTFLELEAVLRTPDDESHSPERLSRLVEVLEIEEADRIAVSYSDLRGL